MNKTSIQWTDMSANPIRARRIDGKQRVPGHFCQKISSGCTNCYASRMQPRFGLPQFPGTNKSAADMGVEVFLDDSVLQSLLKRRKPCRVFLCDMTDLFGEWVPFDMIDRIFAVMALTPHITYQVLTKRPERMAGYLNDPLRDGIVQTVVDNMEAEDDCPFGDQHAPLIPHLPLRNVWLGTSCEDQPRADERIPHLLRCPAAIRFLSIEPQIGPISLDCYPSTGCPTGWLDGNPSIGWIIQGGESGKNARPFDLQWARDIRDQCKSAGVAYFLKQLGANAGRVDPLLDDLARNAIDDPECDPADIAAAAQSSWERVKLNDSHGGDESEWPDDLRGCRAFPEAVSA